MIFVKDAKIYAKVWNIEAKDKYTDVRISTSERDRDDKLVYSNWNARAFGNARSNLDGVSNGDTVLITKCKLTNESYTNKDGKKKSFLMLYIIECEKVDWDRKDSSDKPKADSKVSKKDSQNDEEDLPF